MGHVECFAAENWCAVFQHRETHFTPSIKTANIQSVIQGVVCGPVPLHIEGFRPAMAERHSEDGTYGPLIGYIPLKQAQAAADMVGHRLAKVGRMGLK